MIVVVLIGMLATLALPAFQKVRMHSQNATTVNDLRTFMAAFEQYNLEIGDWPPDTMGNDWPDTATENFMYSSYIKQSQWEKQTPIGGYYDWDPNQFLSSVGVSVEDYTVSAEQVTLLDEMIDDGNLGTGLFRDRGSGVIWVMEYN